ncbi:MAG: hypothetical protein ACRDHE_06790, partial [Ktedonobacterales bacterium]
MELFGQGCEKNPGLVGAEQVAIFDARSGALERTLGPHVLFDATASALTYPNFIWSPDGRFLTMPLWLSARLETVPGVPTSRLWPASCADRGLPEACVG